jgi:hypothetical protein
MTLNRPSRPLRSTERHETMAEHFLPGSSLQWTPDDLPNPIPAVLVKTLPSDDCVAVIRLETGEVTISRIGNLWIP